MLLVQPLQFVMELGVLRLLPIGCSLVAEEDDAGVIGEVSVNIEQLANRSSPTSASTIIELNREKRLRESVLRRTGAPMGA